MFIAKHVLRRARCRQIAAASNLHGAVRSIRYKISRSLGNLYFRKVERSSAAGSISNIDAPLEFEKIGFPGGALVRAPDVRNFRFNSKVITCKFSFSSFRSPSAVSRRKDEQINPLLFPPSSSLSLSFASSQVGKDQRRKRGRKTEKKRERGERELAKEKGVGSAAHKVSS